MEKIAIKNWERKGRKSHSRNNLRYNLKTIGAVFWRKQSEIGPTQGTAIYLSLYQLLILYSISSLIRIVKSYFAVIVHTYHIYAYTMPRTSNQYIAQIVACVFRIDSRKVASKFDKQHTTKKLEVYAVCIAVIFFMTNDIHIKSFGCSLAKDIIRSFGCLLYGRQNRLKN